MFQSRKTNFLMIMILLGVIAAFAYSYNVSVTRAVADVAYNDRAILQRYNNEIIEKLSEEDSIETWSEIVEQYEDIVIVIENSENKVVTRSIGRTWSALDVKVQTPFEYKGRAYVIKSSVYLLRDYVGDVRALSKFFFAEFLIGISALCLLIFTIYTVMLRPFRSLYKAIEDFDKTGELKDVRIKGYAGEIYRRFVFMTENLEKQQNNQRRIIASISHDIKTPLTSIMGYTEQLEKADLSEERRKRYLSTVYEKSEQIRSIMEEFDDYLSYNKLRDFKKTEISAKELMDDIISEYADELENSGVDLQVTVSGDRNAQTAIDIIRFKRVFGNVFSNSLKHFDKKEKIISVNIRPEKEKFMIFIDDSGEGVKDDKLEEIFEPLYTSDKGRRVAGLGLSICREIIESHAGRIYATKSELGGLKICIELERTGKKNVF